MLSSLKTRHDTSDFNEVIFYLVLKYEITAICVCLVIYNFNWQK